MNSSFDFSITIEQKQSISQLKLKINHFINNASHYIEAFWCIFKNVECWQLKTHTHIINPTCDYKCNFWLLKKKDHSFIIKLADNKLKEFSFLSSSIIH